MFHTTTRRSQPTLPLHSSSSTTNEASNQSVGESAEETASSTSHNNTTTTTTIVPLDSQEFSTIQEEEEEVITTPEQRQYILAWLGKRQLVKRQGQKPVDVDSLTEWSVEEENAALAAILETEADAIMKSDEEVHSRTLPSVLEEEEEDAVTYVSAARSDQTPIVSNLGTASKQQQRFRRYQRRITPSSTALLRSNNTGAAEKDPSDSNHTTDSPAEIPFTTHHAGFFDIRTKHGKLVYGLLVLLLLAVTTMVLSATSNQTKKNRAAAPVWDDFSSKPNATSTTLPPLVTVSTPVPSPRPSLVPTRLATTTTKQPNISSSQPSAAPSLGSVVSVELSSLSPTAADTTSSTGSSSSVPTTASTTTSTPSTTTTTTATPTAVPSTPPSRAPSPVPTATSSSVPTVLRTAEPTVPVDVLVLQQTSTDPLTLVTTDNHGEFGTSVALSTDGTVLAVGAPQNGGVVQVYQRRSADQVWVLVGAVGTNDASNNDDSSFGSTVALNRDGSVLAVGAPGGANRAGRVHVYRLDDNQEYQRMGQVLVGSNEPARLGVGLSLSDDGRRLACGAPYHSTSKKLRLNGQVLVYEFLDAQEEWQLLGTPLEGTGTLDWFGSAVDLADGGWTLVVSALRSPTTKGYVQVFTYDGQEWQAFGSTMVNDDVYGRSLNSDRFGHSVSFSRDAEDGVPRIAIGSPMKDTNGEKDAGMVVVYEKLLGAQDWTLAGDVIVPDVVQEGAWFGYSVQLLHGSILAVGAPGTSATVPGTVQLYRRQVDGSWERHTETLNGMALGDGFGHSVSLVASPDTDQHLSLAIGSTQVSNGGSGYVLTYETRKN